MGASLWQSTPVARSRFESMENEYMKRGYLLPPGCKDLSDVLELKEKRAQSFLPFSPALLAENWTTYSPTSKPWKAPGPLPPVTGQVFIPPHTTVKKLAALLGQKPFEIIADLMALGVFATVDFLLDFKTISKVARMHGFLAIKAA